MKVLLPVGEIPLLSKVTKRTGDKIYEIRDKIIIYAEEGCVKPINEIKALPGTRLLVSTDPQYSFAIVSVPETLEVLWEVTDDKLRDFLDDKEIF